MAYPRSQLAKAIGISPNRIAEIVNNRRRITADTALRLSLYFGNSPEFWMNLQTHYDLKMAKRKLKPEDAKRIKSLRARERIKRARQFQVDAAPRQQIAHAVDQLVLGTANCASACLPCTRRGP